LLLGVVHEQTFLLSYNAIKVLFIIPVRLTGKECGKLHTEMPDKIQPYKHYSSEVIESTIDYTRSDCPADNATDFKAFSGQLESILKSYWMKYRKQSFPLD
jgi:hypothetical protein